MSRGRLIPLVLAVDDDERNRKLLAALVAAEGFECILADSGTAAVAAAKAELPDLILLDVMMPGMDGIEVTERLKADDATERIPIIALTAAPDKETRMRALEAGADDFLHKPIDTTELRVRARNLLRLKHIGDDLVRRASDLNALVDRRTAELRESERFLRGALDALAASIAILDQDLVVLAVNEAWRVFADENELGDPGYCVGRPYFEACPEPATSSMLAGIRQILDGSRAEYTEEYACHSPTEERWFIARATRFRGDGPIRIVVAHEDITERRAAEQALRDTERRLSQAQKIEAIGRLAGGIAHDYNNMLSVITSYASFIGEAVDSTSSIRADVDEVLNAAGRAASLTHQLLAFSRRQVFEPRPASIADILAGMDKMLHALISEEVQLHVDVREDVSPVLVDISQIEQVIMNLVINARDAMPCGGQIDISVACRTVDSDEASTHPGLSAGCYVELLVTDVGGGMDAQTQARVFEPFFTTKATGQGTGLGLATVYGIVKQSQGYISVTSEIGRGTTFSVLLPVLEGTEAALPQQRSQPRVDIDATGTTILVVEDERAVRKIVRRALRRRGFDVLVAPGPGEAILMAEQYEAAIHLLLTDVIMPMMDGWHLAERLAATRPEMSILFMTGHTEDLDIVRQMAERRAPLIRKPFTPDELVDKVVGVLASRPESR